MQLQCVRMPMDKQEKELVVDNQITLRLVQRKLQGQGLLWIWKFPKNCIDCRQLTEEDLSKRPFSRLTTPLFLNYVMPIIIWNH